MVTNKSRLWYFTDILVNKYLNEMYMLTAFLQTVKT